MGGSWHCYTHILINGFIIYSYLWESYDWEDLTLYILWSISMGWQKRENLNRKPARFSHEIQGSNGFSYNFSHENHSIENLSCSRASLSPKTLVHSCLETMECPWSLDGISWRVTDDWRDWYTEYRSFMMLIYLDLQYINDLFHYQYIYVDIH